MDGRVLGAGADGAGVRPGLARLAQAQVPARQQQHRRLASAARPARPLRRRGRHRVLGRVHEAARLRVVRAVGLAESLLGGGMRRTATTTDAGAEEQGVERGAQARRGGLVAARQAAPRLQLGG